MWSARQISRSAEFRKSARAAASIWPVPLSGNSEQKSAGQPAITKAFEKDGKTVEPFDNADSDNIIELNGIKSELVISTFNKENL